MANASYTTSWDTTQGDLVQIRIADLSLESGLTDLTVAALPVLPCKKGDWTGKPEALDRRASEFGFVDPQSGGAEYTLPVCCRAAGHSTGRCLQRR